MEMQNLARAAQSLEGVLGLDRHPVAVRFVSRDEGRPEGFAIPSGRRYCQVLMEAGQGNKVLLTPENIVCPASAAALGFKPLPVKLETGEMLAAYGIFASKEAGRRTILSMPRLPLGQYQAVAACPLGEAPYEPDVVVLEAQPEHLMWVAWLPCGRRAAGSTLARPSCRPPASTARSCRFFRASSMRLWAATAVVRLRM